MQIAQRCILVIGMGIILSFFAVFFFNERKSKLLKDWEIVHAERFLNKLCQTGECSQEEYILLFEALNCSGIKVEIRIEEYQPEQDLSKKRYYSMISWEEIKSFLFKEERYVFSDDSIVLLEISHQGRLINRKSRRFGWVIGEYGNDT